MVTAETAALVAPRETARRLPLGWLWSALSLGILLTTVWLAWKKQTVLCHQLLLIAVTASSSPKLLIG